MYSLEEIKCFSMDVFPGRSPGNIMNRQLLDQIEQLTCTAIKASSLGSDSAINPMKVNPSAASLYVRFKSDFKAVLATDLLL